MQEIITTPVTTAAGWDTPQDLQEKRKDVNIAGLVSGMIVKGITLRWRTDVVEAINSIYPYSLGALSSRKGEWKFLGHHERGNGFCAVYEREGRPQTLFSGEYQIFPHVQETAAVLSANVLEQRVLSWPPRAVTQEDIVMNVLKATIYPLAIPTLMLAWDHNMYAMVEEYLRTKPHLVPIIVTTMGFGPFILAGLFKPLGLIADRARIKNLPEEAYSYTYGIESIFRIKSGEYFRSHRGEEE